MKTVETKTTVTNDQRKYLNQNWGAVLTVTLNHKILL